MLIKSVMESYQMGQCQPVSYDIANEYNVPAKCLLQVVN